MLIIILFLRLHIKNYLHRPIYIFNFNNKFIYQLIVIKYYVSYNNAFYYYSKWNTNLYLNLYHTS